MSNEDIVLLRKITWHCMKGHPEWEFDDLFSEACIAYLEIIARYDPQRAQKSTFLWCTISRRLRKLIAKKLRTITIEALIPPGAEDLLGLCSEEPSPEQAVLNQERQAELFTGLSPAAQSVVCTTLAHAQSLPIHAPKLCRGEVARRLHEQGNSWSTVWRGIQEVKAFLSTAY